MRAHARRPPSRRRRPHLRQTSLQPLAACQRRHTAAALPARSGTPSHDSTCVSVWSHRAPPCAGAAPLSDARRGRGDAGPPPSGCMLRRRARARWGAARRGAVRGRTGVATSAAGARSQRGLWGRARGRARRGGGRLRFSRAAMSGARRRLRHGAARARPAPRPPPPTWRAPAPSRRFNWGRRRARRPARPAGGARRARGAGPGPFANAPRCARPRRHPGASRHDWRTQSPSRPR
jgi:hypothetical protein